jgi:hypothetical protein
MAGTALAAGMTGETRDRQLQREITEIAKVLLREHPPGTPMRDVWAEALSIHRLQFALDFLEPLEDGGSIRHPMGGRQRSRSVP